MKIAKVATNKKEYLELLLLADEQEDMIDKYLDKGDMFVLEDDGVKAECVVTEEEEGIYEVEKHNSISLEILGELGEGKFIVLWYKSDVGGVHYYEKYDSILWIEL